jgi:hypothetical protein
MAEFAPYRRNHIDGAWVDGGAGRITVTDLATGAALAEHALADAGDIDRAEQAARRVRLSGGSCQTISNWSQFLANSVNLPGTKLAPLGESGGAVELEILSRVEVALRIEMVVH